MVVRNRSSVVIMSAMLVFLSACQKTKPALPPPPVVEIADVVQRDVPIIHEWVGTADGIKDFL